MPRFHTLALYILFLIGLSELSYAQRSATNYQSLLARTRQANTYLNVNAFPDLHSDSMMVYGHFRLEYDFLTFTRSASQDKPDVEFATDVIIYVDVYKAGSMITERTQEPENAEFMRDGSNQRRLTGNQSRSTSTAGSPSIPLATEAWKGRAEAKNYSQTISNRHFLEGFVQFNLPTGDYDLVFSIREESQTRIRPIGRVRHKVTNFSIPQSVNPIYLLEKESAGYQGSIMLLGYGNQVPYGSDFDLLIPVQKNVDLNTFSVKISALEYGRRDTTIKNVLAEIDLESNMIEKGTFLSENREEPFQLSQLESDHLWIRLQIPGSTFPNVPMKIEVFESGKTSPYAVKNIQSKWVDIPTSLLNVSVAIDMMESLLDEDEFKRVRRLSASEKETFFKDFWISKDPSPQTEYNELMVEFYKRVDIAYERYTSATTPGYSSDFGKTYILMGEPDRVSRRFPPDQPALEVWEYGTRQIIFQASTGFGDFKIIRTTN
jgi:GWxTD domain-containing protein